MSSEGDPKTGNGNSLQSQVPSAPPCYNEAGHSSATQPTIITLAPQPQLAILQGTGQQQQFIQLNPANTVINPRAGRTEPMEAAVARPLSIISIFCFLQLWFAIPAIVLAHQRYKKKEIYKTSIALSMTAIIIGMVATFIMIGFGYVFPYSYYYNSDYSHCSPCAYEGDNIYGLPADSNATIYD